MKKIKKPVTKPAPTVPELVDEFVALSAEIAAMKPKKDRLDAIEAVLLKLPQVTAALSSASLLVDGAINAVEISACRGKRAITGNALLHAKLGTDVYVAHSKMNLETFDALVPVGERKLYITETDGNRLVKPLQRAA